jgi:hypothetical protein
MMKRSVFLIAAFALVASLAHENSASAGPTYVVTVTESINVSEKSGGQDITGVALAFTGLNQMTGGVTIGPLMNATSTAAGTYATFPPLHFNTELPAVGSSGSTITLGYGTPVFSLGGTVSFKVTSTTDSLATLQTLIKLGSITVSPPPNSLYTITTTPLSFSVQTVPEPTSMALLGIGMTSFLAFRRFFKRGSIA